MKKIIIFLCVFMLMFNIVSPAVLAANKEYDHEALMEYDGYGKAMYETIVEETSFITGQYTENKEFVTKSIDQIKDYANFWWNEQNWDSEPWTYDRFKEMIAKPAGYLLTVGDWVGKLFGGYGDKYYPPEIDLSGYNAFVNVNPECVTDKNKCNDYEVKQGFVMIINGDRYTSKNYMGQFQATWDKMYTDDTRDYVLKWMGKNYGRKNMTIYEASSSVIAPLLTGGNNGYGSNGNFGVVMIAANFLGVSITFEKDGAPVKPEPSKPNSYEKFKNHVYDNIENVATPEPRPYLVCPNGSKIQMSISGSTFLSADGKAMIVNKDGTAEIDSAICKLGWDKPVVKYIDDRAAIQTPDDKWRDAETGKLLDGDGGEDECGILCSLGKLAEFVLDFFEKLLDFFIKLLIPEDMDFITEGFSDLSDLFSDKFSILISLKDFFTGLFDDSDSPALDYVVDLPAVGKPIKLLDMELISVGVPIMKRIISAVIVIFTVIHVYRKIVGDGGVMEK